MRGKNILFWGNILPCGGENGEVGSGGEPSALSTFKTRPRNIYTFLLMRSHIQGPPKNLPRSIYPNSSIAHPNQTLRRIARQEMKYTTNNSTRSVNIKIKLQTGSPDHPEINERII